MRVYEGVPFFWPCCGCESSSEDEQERFVTTSPVGQSQRTTKPVESYENSMQQAIYKIGRETLLS